MAQGRLTVAAGAQVIGEIVAGEAVIEGLLVQGNINATDRIELNGTAQVVGDLHTSRLSIQEGAKLMGSHDIDSESITKLTPASIPGGDAGRVPAKPKPVGASAGKADPLSQAI